MLSQLQGKYLKSWERPMNKDFETAIKFACTEIVTDLPEKYKRKWDFDYARFVAEKGAFWMNDYLQKETKVWKCDSCAHGYVRITNADAYDDLKQKADRLAEAIKEIKQYTIEYIEGEEYEHWVKTLCNDALKDYKEN